MYSLSITKYLPMHLNGIEIMKKESKKVTVVRAGAAVAECTKRSE